MQTAATIKTAAGGALQREATVFGAHHGTTTDPRTLIASQSDMAADGASVNADAQHDPLVDVVTRAFATGQDLTSGSGPQHTQHDVSAAMSSMSQRFGLRRRKRKDEEEGSAPHDAFSATQAGVQHVGGADSSIEASLVLPGIKHHDAKPKPLMGTVDSRMNGAVKTGFQPLTAVDQPQLEGGAVELPMHMGANPVLKGAGLVQANTAQLLTNQAQQQTQIQQQTQLFQQQTQQQTQLFQQQTQMPEQAQPQAAQAKKASDFDTDFSDDEEGGTRNAVANTMAAATTTNTMAAATTNTMAATLTSDPATRDNPIPSSLPSTNNATQPLAVQAGPQAVLSTTGRQDRPAAKGMYEALNGDPAALVGAAAANSSNATVATEGTIVQVMGQDLPVVSIDQAVNATLAVATVQSEAAVSVDAELDSLAGRQGAQETVLTEAVPANDQDVQ